MYLNKCTKCGKEFETKNPKRVICPDCLYPEKKPLAEGEKPAEAPKAFYTSDTRPYNQGQRPQGQGNFNRRPRPQGQGGYNNNYNRPQGQGGYNNNNYNRPPQGQGGYNNNNYNRPQGQGGYNNNNYNRPPQGQGGYRPRPFNGPNRPRVNQAPKQLLVSKEQLAQIEELYKRMLPLPNPNSHEVIGEIIQLEARKVFFGINLIRQKMMLTKLPYPKRKLAVSPDQLIAIKALYEPLLPLPPIGCHKILAAQLRVDEWRVHVGIGLVRKQLGLERWITDRDDAPEQFKTKK